MTFFELASISKLVKPTFFIGLSGAGSRYLSLDRVAILLSILLKFTYHIGEDQCIILIELHLKVINVELFVQRIDSFF